MNQYIDQLRIERSAITRLLARCSKCPESQCAKRDEYNKNTAQIDEVLSRYGEPYQGSLREMADSFAGAL